MRSIGRVALALASVLVTTIFVQPFRPVVVKGESMAPTFDDGQLVLASRLTRKPQVGDVVIVEHDGTTLIKRVALGPGRLYPEAYLRLMHSWTPIISPALKRDIAAGTVACRLSRIPSDQVFLLGDNPEVSLDSRYFGPIPISAIKGYISDVS
jgi:signal peptidase I